MKRHLIALSMVFATQAFAGPLHLDLEMTSDEYRDLLGKTDFKKRGQEFADPSIEAALKLGERLSKWIALVNTGRTPETAIRLTSAATRRGIPIDKPNVYSPSIIRTDMTKVVAELPASMRDVINSNNPLPGTISIDDETFIKHARLLDKIYQNAARYKSVNVYRAHYITAANKDLRGYYYLKTSNIGAQELRDVALIPANKVTPIKDALTLICQNATSNLSGCKSEVSNAFSKNNVSAVYTAYIGKAMAIWENFFKIPVSARRSDIQWSGNTAVVPFNNPSLPKFRPYLQNNIEAEFQWGTWAMKLNFGNFPRGPYLKFEPGVVPHVNGLGGNEIVMDSNQPIEEYESQWTIRHEFGHVIGLPDCYHEFYDVTLQAYVNYQLDTTDLMCSRAGNMNERIYKELHNAYSR